MIKPFILQKHILEPLHSNHVDKKTRPLAIDSVYWVDMNADIENTIQQSAKYLEQQQT